jgi:hypothetical protein
VRVDIERERDLATGFTALSGPAGTRVNIAGGGFDGATAVTLAGVRALFTVEATS